MAQNAQAAAGINKNIFGQKERGSDHDPLTRTDKPRANDALGELLRREEIMKGNTSSDRIDKKREGSFSRTLIIRLYKQTWVLKGEFSTHVKPQPFSQRSKRTAEGRQEKRRIH